MYIVGEKSEKKECILERKRVHCQVCVSISIRNRSIL